MFGPQMRWREMETETNAQLIMPLRMWMCVSKRKPSTSKLLADIPLNKSFLKKITYSINFRFVTGAIQNLKEIQRTCPTFKTLSPKKIAGITWTFLKTNATDSPQPPPHPKQITLLVLCTTLKIMRFWSFTWLKNSMSKVCGSTCNYLLRIVNSSGFEKNWQWHCYECLGLNASVSQSLCVWPLTQWTALNLVWMNGSFWKFLAFREIIIRNYVIDLDVSRNSKFIFLAMI